MINYYIKQQQLKKAILQNRDKLYRLALSWTQDPLLADDLVQDAQHKAITSLSQLRDENKLNSWVCSILVNNYRDWLRKQKDTVDIDSLEINAAENPYKLYETEQTSQLVRSAIGRLNEQHKYVLTMVDLMGFSYEEVAFALGIPIGTVMSRLCRARNNLHQMLSKHFANEFTPDSIARLRRVK